MSPDNHLVLAGVVHKTPQTRHSPAGIPISTFPLMHRSQQVEAGMSREVNCRIGVIASGEALQQQVAELQEGSEVRISGFISRANNRQGEYRLVLHAQQIEMASAPFEADS